MLIKRLYRFILKSFLPLFAMTFFIVLFIVLMQFLWRYVDDLVGKGLPFDVIAELFFYAAISMVPMALPLAILLASLMTFGNLGEKFELTAMKAAGISLLQVMSPLIVLIFFVAVGAFFFQNNVLPHAQVKMWTLLFSMKQKSPEVEIPEGVFYDQIPGYNLYVESKNPETGVLKKVMIYNVSQGGDNASIVMADSARIAFTKDNRYLYLHLYRGEQFENLREQSAMTSSNRNVPFRREIFEDKEVLIPFDANFNRLDDQGMKKQYVGKNIAELRYTIDSISKRVDSIGDKNSRALLSQSVAGVARNWNQKKKAPEPFSKVVMPNKIPNLDSLLSAMSESELRNVFSQAKQQVSMSKSDFEFKSNSMADDKKSIRRHGIELLKKFTLSVACIIFFFIGAPLGAIIRKGGLGTPLVISVLLFLVYYIIDNTGYKMARDGRWPIWLGMWMSTFILAPLGGYVTYKALNDSAVFDKDAWLIKLRRFIGAKLTRQITFKEVIINDIDVSKAREMLASLCDETSAMIKDTPIKYSYKSFWMKGVDIVRLKSLSEQLENVVLYMHDCRDVMVVGRMMDYPILRSEWIYAPGNGWAGKLLMWFVPFGLPLYIIGLHHRRILRGELQEIVSTTNKIQALL